VSENTVKGQTVASRPRLLDLFCCAGGAAMGYHRAGFDVVGVDIKPQPRYPFEFVQRDAIEVLDNLVRDGDVLGRYFDAVHASPPCQSYTPLRALHPDKTYPDLVDATRARLDQTGLPYIIENVMTAPLIKEKSIVLCGRDAAWDAAGAAAWAALAPTVEALQVSALDLLDRMLPGELIQIPAVGVQEAARVCGVPIHA
jgi:23S rRNA G2069 N7-methylase RlmK/C1962 C5-methylase RlmI